MKVSLLGGDGQDGLCEAIGPECQLVRCARKLAHCKRSNWY